MEIVPASQPVRNFNTAQQFDPAEASECPGPANDTVRMSRDALLLTEALRAAQNAPDVRADKVAEIRARIQDGTYQIDARKIAMRLLTDEADIFSL